MVGPSGSGKSSLIKAGLIPALWRGALPGSERWFIVEMTPGANPLDELEVALTRIAADQGANIREHLERDERGLLRVAGLILPQDGSELVIVIDQFEEVFTLVEDEAARSRFLDLLHSAVTGPRSRARIVVTLRADFYDRPLHYPQFGELMRSRMETLLPLTVGGLERAITRPAKQVGVAFEPGLAALISDDVNYQPGALPLLQYALTELFEQRSDHLLTRQTYESIGGAVGALARRAEEIYQELDEVGREATRQMFLRLVTVSEEGGDGQTTPDTRRRVPRAELLAISDDEDLMDEIIDTFAAYRLLSLDHDPSSRRPTVEVAHEALLREWVQLRGWLEESRADIRAQRLLLAAAEEWRAAGRDPSYLLRGARLSQFEAWAGKSAVALTQDERAFLDDSLTARQTRQAEERARQQRELEAAKRLAETESARAEAEKQRAEEQTQAAGRLRQRAVWLAGALVIAAILAVAAVIFGQQARTQESIAVAEANERAVAQAQAEAQKEEADTQRSIAQTEAEQRAAAEAEALQRRDEALVQASIGLASQAVLELYDSSPERSVLLALEALDNYPYTWQAERALSQAVIGSRLRQIFQHEAWVHTARWSPDETRILTASDDGTAKVWDAITGEELLALSADEDKVWDAQWSPDGSHIVTRNSDNAARVWDATTGEVLSTLPHTDLVVGVEWSPDGTRIVTAGKEGVAKVWDAKTGEELLTFSGHTEWVNTAMWSPSGNRIVSASDDGTAKVWDAKTGEELYTFTLEDWVVTALWSPDGSQILTISGDELVRIWDATTGEELFTLAGHDAWVPRAAWSPDGKRIATVSWNDTAKIWNAETGEEISTFSGHNSYVLRAAWSSDGTRIVTSSIDGSARIWNPDTGKEELVLYGHGSEVGWTIWSADDSHILTASMDGTAKIWDVKPALLTVTGLNGWAHAPAWSPEGDRIAATFMDGIVRVWQVSTGEEILTMQKYDTRINGVTWSPDGRYILSAYNK